MGQFVWSYEEIFSLRLFARRRLCRRRPLCVKSLIIVVGRHFEVCGLTIGRNYVDNGNVTEQKNL